MEPQIIPLSSTGRAVQLTLLNNVSVTLLTYWNNVTNMWYMNMQNDVGDAIVQGLALVPNINVLRYSPQLTETLGEFRIFDVGGEGNATITSLGDTAVLIYYAPGLFEELYPDYNNIIIKPLSFNPSDVLDI